jgi:hypothetical protein
MSLKFARLTRPAVRALEPGKRINEHGITAERQTNGAVRYSINVMSTVDAFTVWSAVRARVPRESRQSAPSSRCAQRREDRLDLPTGRKTQRTFASAGEKYLQRIEHHPKHGRNMKAKRHHMRERPSPYFKSQRPDLLTDCAVAHYVTHRKEHGATVATINRELAILSHFLKARQLFS